MIAPPGTGASSRTPRIFISAVSPLQSSTADILLTALRASGCEIVWHADFRGYDFIENEIARCDALLAVVDDRWSCSTWMMSELHWAMGYPGSGLTDNQPIPPRPAFVLMLHETASAGFLSNLCQAEVLPVDAGAACARILHRLG